MFADPSILDTIVSVASLLLQDERASDSAPQFFCEVRPTFDSFGADPCGIRSEASTRDTRALRRAGSVGDAARRGSGGGSRSCGERGVDTNDP
jgi:hypothetical protein